MTDNMTNEAFATIAQMGTDALTRAERELDEAKKILNTILEGLTEKHEIQN